MEELWICHQVFVEAKNDTNDPTKWIGIVEFVGLVEKNHTKTITHGRQPRFFLTKENKKKKISFFDFYFLNKQTNKQNLELKEELRIESIWKLKFLQMFLWSWRQVSISRLFQQDSANWLHKHLHWLYSMVQVIDPTMTQLTSQVVLHKCNTNLHPLCFDFWTIDLPKPHIKHQNLYFQF